MAIREGRWDCPSCGAVAQLGRHVYCTGCGAPRPKEVAFYLPDDAEVVTDSERLAQANAGADWVCQHCGGSARATDEACPGCGAPRGSSPEHAVVDYDLENVPRSGKPQTLVLRSAGQTRPAKKSHFVRNVFVLLLVSIVSWVAWANRTRHLDGAVVAKQWERSIQMEAYRTVREEGWSVPTGGRSQRSYRAIREYRQVLDHYETKSRQVSERVQVGTRTYTCGQTSKGNGYFQEKTCTEPEYETRYHTETYQDPAYRQEPVWDTKYEYLIERWVPATLLREGGDTTQPAWPRTVVRDTLREGEKKERYVYTFRSGDGTTYTTEVPLVRFTRFRVGERVPLLVNGNRARIDTTRVN